MKPLLKVRLHSRTPSSFRLRLTLRFRRSWTSWRLRRATRRLPRLQRRLALLQRQTDSQLLRLKQTEQLSLALLQVLQELADSQLYRETGQLEPLQPEGHWLPEPKPAPMEELLPPPRALLSPEELTRLAGPQPPLTSPPSSES